MSQEQKVDFELIAQTYQQELTAGLSNPNLEIKPSQIPNAGIGVFAKKDFELEEVVEFCHSIVLDWRRKYVSDKKITQYAYSSACQCNECKTHGPQVVLPTGFGMVYNSSNSKEEQNCGFTILPNKNLIVFFAMKPIKKGEEILTWWGQAYYDSWCRPKPTTEEHNEKTKQEQK